MAGDESRRNNFDHIRRCHRGPERLILEEVPPFCASPSLRTSSRAVIVGFLAVVWNVRHLDNDDMFDLGPTLPLRVARLLPFVAQEPAECEAKDSADHGKVVRNIRKTFQCDMAVRCGAIVK